jgi:hypothetical protein
MKSTPLYLIIARLNHMPLDEQIALLCKMVEAERPYSVRRNELLSLLQGKRTKQLKRDTRRAA